MVNGQLALMEKKNHAGASLLDVFYGDWRAGRLIFFFPGAFDSVLLRAPSSTNTHIAVNPLPTPRSSQLPGRATTAGAPGGGETKIIIGSSLSSTALCASHIWSILWWQAAQRGSFASKSSMKHPPKAGGPLGRAAASSGVGGGGRQALTLIWSVVTDCAVIEFSEVLKTT